MQAFGVNRTNRLQLINLAPTNVLELILVSRMPVVQVMTGVETPVLSPS